MRSGGKGVHGRWRSKLFGAVALLFASVAPAADIDEQTLHYQALYGQINAGAVAIRIRHDSGGYAVDSTATPNALAKLFGAKIHNTVTRFVYLEDEIALAGGEETVADDDNGAKWFRFNRAESRIEFSNGKQHAIADGDQFEAAAFPLLLMLRAGDSIAAIGGLRVLEVSARRAREYIYEQPVEETVAVAAGEFPAWKIVRHRNDRPADKVTVWLRRDGHMIPLKITVAKNGKTSMLQFTGGGP